MLETSVNNENNISSLEINFSLTPMYEKKYAKDPKTGKGLVIIEYYETTFPKRNYWIQSNENKGPIEKISVVHFTNNIARTVFRVKEGWDIDINQSEKKLTLTAVSKNQKPEKKIAHKTRNLNLIPKKQTEKINSVKTTDAEEKVPVAKQINLADDNKSPQKIETIQTLSPQQPIEKSEITENEKTNQVTESKDAFSKSSGMPSLDGKISSTYYQAFDNKETDHDSYFNAKLSLGGKYDYETPLLDKLQFTLRSDIQYNNLWPNNRIEKTDIELSNASAYLRKGNWQIETGLFPKQLGEVAKIRTMTDSLCPRDNRFFGLSDEEATMASLMTTITYSQDEKWSLMAFFKPWEDHDKMHFFDGQTAIYGNFKQEIKDFGLPPVIDQYIQNISVEKQKEKSDFGFVFGFDPVDWLNLNIAYQHGYNDQPFISRFPIQGLQVNDKGKFDLAQLGAITLDPANKVIADYPEFNQFSTFGTIEIGERLFRYEFAHRDNLPYLCKDLQSELHATTQAVLGLEEDTDYGLFTGYMLYTYIHGSDNNLLFSRKSTPQLALGWEKGFLDENIKTEIGIISALDEYEYAARSEVTFKVANLLDYRDGFLKDIDVSLFCEKNDGAKNTLLGSRKETRLGLIFSKTF